MKIILYLTIIISILKCDGITGGDNKCCKTGVSIIKKTDGDTSVFVKTIQPIVSHSEFEENLFSLVIGRDTSILYCRMTSNIKNNRINMYWDVGNINRIYNNEYLQDSTVKIKSLNNNKDYRNVPYKKCICEMRYLLKYISKIQDLDSLKYFELRLLMLNDLLPELNKISEKKIKMKIEKTKNILVFKGILMNSSLINDLNNLLNPYLLKIEKCDLEKLFFSKMKNSSGFVFDGSIGFVLSKK